MEENIQQNKKNKYGQYFTPAIVADFMIDLADIPPDAEILEPACGEGIFLALLQQKGLNNVTAYEIDNTKAQQFGCVKYESFIAADIQKTFDVVIGNPPYIRWKNLEPELKNELRKNDLWNKYFNSLCDYLYIFILKSVALLKPNGKLVFICPEYWLTTTHSLTLRNYLLQHGYFENIYHFNETPIFDNVAVSTMIFKYVKSAQQATTIQVSKYYAHQKINTEILHNLKHRVNDKNIEHLTITPFKKDERWLLCNDKTKEALKQLENNCKITTTQHSLFANTSEINYNTIGDFCDIANGLVSGLDEAFQIHDDIINDDEKKSVLQVVKAKDVKPYYHEKITRYFYINQHLNEDEIQHRYPNFYKQLQPFRNQLANRYQYNRVIPYWHWVFPRSFHLFSGDEKRILVPCKERISNKNYFRFALAQSHVYPTQDVTTVFKKSTTRESIEYILCWLNNYRIFDWLKTNGIVKGNIVEFSEKPIASIPFRAIDWTNENEVLMHDRITSTCQLYLETKNKHLLQDINTMIDNLLIINNCP